MKKARTVSICVVIVLFLYGIVSRTPLWTAYVPLPGWTFLVLLGLLSAVLLTVGKRTIHGSIVLISAGILAASTIAGIYWNALTIAIFPAFFVVTLLAVALVSEGEVRGFLRLSTIFMMVVMIGAWIGFLYVVAGGAALLEFHNPDGRINRLYLTTLSNFRLENFIRPAGIYDEPGTFSFFICALAAARHLMGMRRDVTWAMLLGGFITFSLAHVVYVVVHAAAENISFKNTIKVLAVLLIAGGLLHGTGVHEGAEELLLTRLQVEDGELVGDNRSDLTVDTYGYLDLSSAIFGLAAVGTLDLEQFVLSYPAAIANPLSPMARHGFLVAGSYYVVLILLALYGIRKRSSLVLLGLALLLLQRPFAMYLGYSLWPLLGLWIASRKPKVEKVLGGPKTSAQPALTRFA